MGKKDNSIYKKPYSNIQHFNDFGVNKEKELDELEKMNRSDFQKNLKYNKVTHKYDDLSKDEVDHKIKNVDFKKPNHKYKIVEKFDEFLNNNLETDNDRIKSYMFFENIKTIRNQVGEILEFDERDVDNVLNDGHNWAEDHVSSAKELVEQVFNFLNNQVNESASDDGEMRGNYMFFDNLESIYDMCDELSEIDEVDVDNILTDGHDWAEDHISSSKEKLSHVYNFLKNELE